MSFNDEFIYIKTDEYCSKVTDGTHDSPKRVEEGKYLVTSKHIKGRSINYEDAYFISEENYNKINLRSKVDQWDVLISMIGAYCGFCYVERDSNIDYAVKNVGILKTGSKLKAEWLYYYLNSKAGKNYLETIKAGSTQPYISLGELKKIPIPIPKNELVMNKIVFVLSSLDEKIETNNQINQKLEEMAQAIFKQWFVNFEFPNEDGEPYKSSGGEMVESEIGMLPKGWEIKQLKGHIKFIKGKKPKIISETTFENSEVYLTIDVLNRNSVQYAVNDKVVLATKMDILMVMDGASSGTLYYGMNGIVGSTLAKIEVASELINEDIVYFFLKNNEDNIKMHLTGSAIPHTDKEFINRLYIAIPEDKDMLTNVVKILSDIRKKIIVNDEASNALKNIRDILLPKLMSGEIRVPLE